MLMEGYTLCERERCKKTTKNLIKRKYLPVKFSSKIASNIERSCTHLTYEVCTPSGRKCVSGSSESHKHYYYGSKMCLALATAWRIIKNFFYESYIIQIRVAMYVGTRQPPMRFGALMCARDLVSPRSKNFSVFSFSFRSERQNISINLHFWGILNVWKIYDFCFDDDKEICLTKNLVFQKFNLFFFWRVFSALTLLPRVDVAWLRESFSAFSSVI